MLPSLGCAAKIEPLHSGPGWQSEVIVLTLAFYACLVGQRLPACANLGT